MSDQIANLTTGVAIATDATALALPPTTYGQVPSWWASDVSGDVPFFELELWADGVVNLTSATLYGAVLHPFSFNDLTVTADATTNQLASNGHGKLTGDGPFTISSTLTLPGGLQATGQYWVIKVDANNFKAAASLTDALAGTAIDLTTNGTGVLTVADDATTMRVHWNTYGLLGLLGDGAIALDAQTSYAERADHSPRCIAYAIVATIASGTGKVSAAMYPIRGA